MAGLVALGVTEGVDARAEDANGGSPSSTSAGDGRSPARASRRTSARKTPTKTRAKPSVGLVATLPGFEMLPDGSSRLFVELTHSTNVTEKREARTLTYVLRGAHIALRNNENALVTVHFNTPVTRARLLPVRGDLVFTVELRADSAPVWRMVDGGDGTSMLQVDFPKGVFLPASETNEALSDPLPRPPNAYGPPGAALSPTAPGPANAAGPAPPPDAPPAPAGVGPAN